MSNIATIDAIRRALPKPTEVEKRKHQRRLFINRCLNIVRADRFLSRELPVEELRIAECFNCWRRANGGRA